MFNRLRCSRDQQDVGASARSSHKTLALALAALLLVGAAACDDDPSGVVDDPPEFTAADGINGGTMYDKFWTSETGWSQSDPNLANFNSFSNFFRCKQCHAWDRLGNAASYIGRAPSTTRPNVVSFDLKAATAAMSEQELFDALWRSTLRRSVSADLSTYDPATNSTVVPVFSAVLAVAFISSGSIKGYTLTSALL